MRDFPEWFNNPIKEWRENPSRALAKRLKIVGMVLAALSFAGYFADLNRLFDLTSHFKAFYLVASLILLLGFLAFREPVWGASIALLFLLNLAEVVPWYLGSPVGTDGKRVKEYRLALINVLTSNNRYQDLISQLETLDPDILVLQELDKTWSQELEPLRSSYPHRKGITRSDNFGIHLFSKYPMENAQILYFRSRPVPYVRAQIVLPETAVEILAVHTLPPANEEGAQVRNHQLLEIADLVASTTYPVVVAGDLNTSMWSPIYNRLERDSRLENSRKGFGVLPSWPAMYAPFMVPIDHILHSEGIEVISCETGENFGSDHLPLIADFRIEPSVVH